MCFRCIVFGDGYNLLKGTRNDSPGFFGLVASHHRMGFAASGLPVRENSSVVTIEDVIN